MVYHIRDFMRWRDRTQMVSREWLYGALSRPVHLRSWRGKIRMYAYLKVFGQRFVRMSWPTYCVQLGICRRARNVHYRLSWKAAATIFMERHCKSCGKDTRSNVMGTAICLRCRFNPKRKYAFMVMTRDARQMGIPKKILDLIPYHQHGLCRLRFLHDLEYMLE